MPTFKRLPGADGKFYDVDANTQEEAQAKLDATVKAPADAPVQESVNPAMDVLQGAGAGLRRGIEGIPGAPGDIAGLGRAGASKLAQFLGADPETVKAITEYDIPYVPDVSSESIHELTTPVFGQSYQPQTTAGKFAATAGEFAPSFINPLGGAKKAIMDIGLGIGAGVASETAGQATAGTRMEPWARAAGGIAAGVAPAAVKSGVEGAATAGKRELEATAEDAALQHGVRLTRGERTGNVNQQMEEQQMLHGARGNYAQAALEQRRQANLQAIKDAGQKIATDVAPARGVDPVQSGGLLNEQTRSRAEGLMDTGGKGIQKAIDEGVVVDTQRLRGLPGELESKLTGPDPYIPDVAIDANTPMAAKALGTIQSFVKKFDDPSKIDESMGSVERLRRTINNMKATTPEDSRALRKVMQSFDDWYDDVVTNDAAISSQYSLPTSRTPEDVLGDLRSGRKTFKEGADIQRPRGKPVGGKEVAKIATEGTLPEETARLFKPNDRGDLSPSAIKAIDRLAKTGAKAEDLDQVRGIVLDTLLNGDPGKVATRVDNFIRNNPSAASGLFTSEQLDRLKNWKETNKRLVPDPKATNPSKSSYGIIGEVAKQGAKGATGNASLLGGVLGGLPGAIAGGIYGGAKEALGAARSGVKAKQALAPADRRSLAEFIVSGGKTGAAKAGVGALQGAQSATVNDPGGEYDGQRGRIIDVGENMIKLKMPDGKTKIIGKELVEPEAAR